MSHFPHIGLTGIVDNLIFGNEMSALEIIGRRQKFKGKPHKQPKNKKYPGLNRSGNNSPFGVPLES